MATPLDPKQIVTIQKLAISNMLEIEALRQLLFEKGIITEEEFVDRYKKLDTEMKEKGEGKYFCRNSSVSDHGAGSLIQLESGTPLEAMLALI